MQIAAILDQVERFNTRYVCVTGGEPLAQPNCRTLLSELCERDYDVSLETSGALDISNLDPRVTVVMDIKAPGSGEVERNRWQNLDVLRDSDQVKFVIADRDDYEWSRAIVSKHDLTEHCAVLFSPVWGGTLSRELADWILADQLDVRLQIQLHKFLWGEAPGH
jgi:7-carboxy-7-deazaguanine synthase